MRYFIELAYNGKNYHGWQAQPNAVSVQELLEKALSTILRQQIKVVGAGRTDAGVHARQLFAHFDVEEIQESTDLVYKLNSYLPKDIAVYDIQEVSDEAHARFDAIEREYEYHISLRKNPFLFDYAAEHLRSPSIDLMNEAAKLLLEYSDFKCFSRSKTDVKTYCCDIRKAIWDQEGDSLIFTIAADRFLRNMVRSVVGTLLEVGYGRMDLKGFRAVIESGDRGRAGASAPAHGLYLTKVIYPERIINVRK